MSLSRGGLALSLTLLLVVASAHAHAQGPSRRVTPSVELAGGYGLELVKIGAHGPSAYAAGLGMRAGVTWPLGLYLGGTFVEHLGWRQVAGARDGSSTYRGAYHRTYAGPELGWAFTRHGLLLRPYVGTGLLLAFGRTVVGRVERNDDNGFVYVAPGLLTAAHAGRWYGGFDVRLVMVPAQPATEWAPALLFVVGTTL